MSEQDKITAEEIEKCQLEVADIGFTFAMTREEAAEILKHPRGKVVKQFMKYLNAVLISAARKFKDVPVGEEHHDKHVKIEE